MKYVRLAVLAVGMVSWFALCIDLAIGYLPHRPDSAAYFMGQLILLPGVFLSSPRILQVHERFRSFGKGLVIAAFGAFLVAFVLFIFGGYRASAQLG